MPAPLDEYPIHQTPLSMARVASSDKNFYDRSYFNAIDTKGELFLVSGFGAYPNLGVTDAFATIRKGERQWAVKFSDALEERSLDLAVGGYRIEVLEPLRRLRMVCEGDGEGGLGFDLTWEGSGPAISEQPHLLMSKFRPTLDASRFAQTGTWTGVLSVDGEDVVVSPDRWIGSRDRSWGIRPVGDGDPAGRLADEPSEGFWWMYVPLRFDEFSIIVILQENPDGYRTLNDATRVWNDGRIEQLGWPRYDIKYHPGTRRPFAATLHLTASDGSPLTVEVTPRDGLALHVGAGYGGDPEWTHGQWRGRNWSSRSVYDLTDPAIAARIPYGVNEYPASVTCNGVPGAGMFEHASMGRHDPTGFADWGSVAP
ncbi:hypothetical protein FCG67_02490 [Rhodococcus oryzae]|uniref:Uncharacterized protein n=1 Tax=Rhodococcus oryzae TaxID=2571143 RepID=A0ABY2RR11_9NOCA|nr:hypothetical protein [Rhodococcus oryzae]TJZ81508.1 hypothetical protein FCG67_02490 [Rhodococcus oryzae]